MATVREHPAAVTWMPTIPEEFDGQLRIDLPDGFEVTEDWWDELYEANRGVRIDLLPTKDQ